MFTKPKVLMHEWLRRAAIAAALISMGFTAYFGWITAGDDIFARYFNAAGGALISGAVPLFFFLSAVGVQRGAAAPAKSFFVLGCLFGFLDAASNSGALFAMREGSKITAVHSTNVANDTRARVDRLRLRDEELTKQIDFWPTNELGLLMAPDAYSKPIETQQFAVALESSKGGCRDRCLAEKHALTKLVQARDLSIDRSKKITERDQIRKELVEAENTAEAKPPKVSPIDVITSKLGALPMYWSAGSLDASENIKEIIYLLITVVLGSGLTILSGGLGYGSTWLRGHSEGPVKPESRFEDRPWLSGPAGHTPHPLHAQPLPQSPHSGGTHISVTSHGGNDDGFRASMEQLDRILARVQARKASA